MKNKGMLAGVQSKSVITTQELDAIGEILNISMGSAATAVSTMLEKQVTITTPRVSVCEFSKVDLKQWEPAMLVRINYVEGICGTNMMLFHKRDVQMIISMLMGTDLAPTENFEFDEFSMSAACEVMNQMMGSSATAMSSFFDKRIDISTPQADIINTQSEFMGIFGIDGEEDIVSVSFRMTIPGVLDTEFVNIMRCDFAKVLAMQALIKNDITEQPTAYQPTTKSQPVYVQSSGQGRVPVSAQQPVQSPRFPDFTNKANLSENVVLNTNMDIMMDLPLTVSVEIGKTTKRIKDIMEFTQGTIIELEKQAGAPVDIVVNGHLIARGDVVVIDDNFGVRVTEIIRTRDLEFK